MSDVKIEIKKTFSGVATIVLLIGMIIFMSSFFTILILKATDHIK